MRAPRSERAYEDALGSTVGGGEEMAEAGMGGEVSGGDRETRVLISCESYHHTDLAQTTRRGQLVRFGKVTLGRPSPKRTDPGRLASAPGTNSKPARRPRKRKNRNRRYKYVSTMFIATSFHDYLFGGWKLK